jgi:hypothetical protein
MVVLGEMSFVIEGFEGSTIEGGNFDAFCGQEFDRNSD